MACCIIFFIEGCSITVDESFLVIIDECKFSMNLKIGGDVPGEIHTVSVCFASPCKKDQVNICVIKQEIHFSCKIQSVNPSEVVIDVLVDRQQGRRERERLQGAAKAFDVIRRYNIYL